MLLIPAIDLRGGKVVRLFQGDYKREKIYSDNPLDFALKWEEDGARMLHIVDLDGAKEGKIVNKNIIKKIARLINIPIEVGGGIRNSEAVADLLESGVARVILGTKAFDGELLEKLISEFGADKIIVGIDARNGIVKTDGWLKESGMLVREFCKTIICSGIKEIIYTDILSDGTLKGPNLESLKEVAEFKELKIIASGGISCLNDIKSIMNLNFPNINGIIIGKALYENSFSFKDALSMMKPNLNF